MPQLLQKILLKLTDSLLTSTHTSIKTRLVLLPSTLLDFSLYDQALRCLSKHVGCMNDEEPPLILCTVRQKRYRLPGHVCTRAMCSFLPVNICGRCRSFCLKKYQGVKLPFIPSILRSGSAICCIQIQDFACAAVASPS